MTVRDVGSLATAIGVAIAAYQLWAAKRQQRTDFEDELNREYREIVRDLPREALLESELSPQRVEEIAGGNFNALYRYIDLSNQQAFLRKEGRISKQRWLEWSEGIESNLNRPVVDHVWQEVKKGAVGSFTELQDLEREGARWDPGATQRRLARRFRRRSR